MGADAVTARPLRLVVTTGPAQLPVTLSQVKHRLGVGDDTTSDDAYLMQLVRAATEIGEKRTGRAFVTQTLTLWLDGWPKDATGREEIWEGWRQGAETNLLTPRRAIELPRPPLQSITSVSTFDDSDTETTYASSNYFVDTATEPGRLVLRNSASAPAPTRAANGLKVVYTAGYGADPGDVPEGLREGVLRLASFFFENRGDCPEDEALRMAGAEVLFRTEKVMRL